MVIENRNTRGILGRPYGYKEELEKEIENLTTGDCPPVSAIDLPLDQSLDLDGLTVMAIKGTGLMVPAEAKNALGTPGVVAKGSITATGNAGSAFTVHGRNYTVDASVGNVNARAEALAQLVNEDVNGPCFATVAAAVVTLYARFPGASGNGTVTAGTGTTSAGNLANGTGEDAIVGILAQDTQSAADQYPAAGIYVAGVFNPNRLIWHSSFTSDEIKRHAFLNSLSMTQIFLRKIRNLSV